MARSRRTSAGAARAASRMLRSGSTGLASRDGLHDVYCIDDSQNNTVLALYFRDEPDTEEAAQATRKADKLVEALNMPGGFLDLGFVVQSALASRMVIGTIKSVHDMMGLRPDLTFDQAWAVLQSISFDQRERGINDRLLRAMANKMFAKKRSRKSSAAA